MFEPFLRCTFNGLPGMQKVAKGDFVLAPDDDPHHNLTAENYNAKVRPGFGFKMSIKTSKLIVMQLL